MVTDDPQSDIVLNRGVYDVYRAAALAGIPRRTLHHWAQTGFYRPSISPLPRDYLWSWADLLALRAIDWLRRKKDDVDLPRVPTHRIREALSELEKDGLARHKLREIVVSDDGALFFQRPNLGTVKADSGRQIALPGTLNLVSPYQDRGPDLLEPRPLLRILPGKLHGEPHVIHTRISTSVLFCLSEMGYAADDILEMYPDVTKEALEQALDLEKTLQRAA
jgi:uncharacterized protein (DUF433 family)